MTHKGGLRLCWDVFVLTDEWLTVTPLFMVLAVFAPERAARFRESFFR